MLNFIAHIFKPTIVENSVNKEQLQILPKNKKQQKIQKTPVQAWQKLLSSSRLTINRDLEFFVTPHSHIASNEKSCRITAGSFFAFANTLYAHSLALRHIYIASLRSHSSPADNLSFYHPASYQNLNSYHHARKQP